MSLLGINYKNFGAKISRKIFITIMIILTLSSNLNINCYKTEDFLLESEINRELFSRMNYYNSLISDLKLVDHISLEVKNSKILLKVLNDRAATDNIFLLPKSLFLTSCDLFPFKETILEALSYLNKDSKVDLNKFSNNLMVVYIMMYYKFADKDKAKKYYTELYRDNLETLKEIESNLPFEVNPEIKLYLDNLPQKNTRSLFFFNEEEIQLAKDLGIELITKVIFENTHQQIINYIKKNTSEDLSVSLLYFINEIILLRKSFI